MLIIGHRGAAGLKPENTIASLRTAMSIGVDMVEFDIRLTKDKVPVLSHDFHLYRTHRTAQLVARMTLSELRKRTAGSERPIVTLDAALKECFGKVLLNIELKPGTAFEHVLPVLQRYVKRRQDWQLIIFSSRKPRLLYKVRELSPHAQLALYHHIDPFVFVRHAKRLELAAVGFHRLNINPLAIEVAKRLKLFIYAYTVNRPEAALLLAQKGIDAVVSDRPDLLLANAEIKRAQT